MNRLRISRVLALALLMGFGNLVRAEASADSAELNLLRTKVRKVQKMVERCKNLRTPRCAKALRIFALTQSRYDKAEQVTG